MRVSSSGLPLVAMDNFSVDVTAYKTEILRHTIELILCHHSIVRAYAETEWTNKKKTLVLYWGVGDNDPNKTKFPYDFKLNQTLPFVMGWLENQDYGREPDIDGSCSKGWREFNSEGVTNGWGMASFTVQPAWAYHHK